MISNLIKRSVENRTGITGVVIRKGDLIFNVPVLHNSIYHLYVVGL
jgi:hypothetical protein